MTANAAAEHAGAACPRPAKPTQEVPIAPQEIRLPVAVLSAFPGVGKTAFFGRVPNDRADGAGLSHIDGTLPETSRKLRLSAAWQGMADLEANSSNRLFDVASEWNERRCCKERSGIARD